MLACIEQYLFEPYFDSIVIKSFVKIVIQDASSGASASTDKRAYRVCEVRPVWWCVERIPDCILY